MDNVLDLGRNLFPDNLFEAGFHSTKTNIVKTGEVIEKVRSKSEAANVLGNRETII